MRPGAAIWTTGTLESLAMMTSLMRCIRYIHKSLLQGSLLAEFAEPAEPLQCFGILSRKCKTAPCIIPSTTLPEEHCDKHSIAVSDASACRSQAGLCRSAQRLRHKACS